jgi:hypothetical protein
MRCFLLRRVVYWCAAALLCNGCALTKHYPAFTDTRSERDGEEIQIDPYRPPAIDREGWIQGVEVVIEVDSPKVWNGPATTARIVRPQSPHQVVGRVYLLGRVEVTDTGAAQPMYAFPLHQLDSIRSQDPYWQFDVEFSGGPAYVTLGSYAAANPGRPLETLPVIGVQEVWRGNKAQPVPNDQRLEEDFGLGTLVSGKRAVVSGQWLAGVDSLNVFSKWMKFPDPEMWGVRLRPGQSHEVTVQPGNISDYPFLAEGDWLAAEAAEAEFLRKVALAGTSRARVLLVCVPREARGGMPPPPHALPCLQATRTYLLQFAGGRISQPFRIERRGGFFSLVVGVLGSFLLLTVSAG